nr:histone-like nucleoid-structuring protein Lsr2 [Actinoplanes sp. NBRC 103695]
MRPCPPSRPKPFWTTTRGPAPAVASPQDNRDRNQAIWEWAGKNGYQVSGRGRIPAAAVEAFHATR